MQTDQELPSAHEHAVLSALQEHVAAAAESAHEGYRALAAVTDGVGP